MMLVLMICANRPWNPKGGNEKNTIIDLKEAKRKSKLLLFSAAILFAVAVFGLGADKKI